MTAPPQLANNKTVLPSLEMIEVLVDGARYGDLEDVQTALQHSVNVDSMDTLGRTGKGCAKTNHGDPLKLNHPRHSNVAMCSSPYGGSQWSCRCCCNTHRSWCGEFLVYQQCASLMLPAVCKFVAQPQSLIACAPGC